MFVVFLWIELDLNVEVLEGIMLNRYICAEDTETRSLKGTPCHRAQKGLSLGLRSWPEQPSGTSRRTLQLPT